MRTRMAVVLAAALAVGYLATLHAATVSKKITWANEQWIPVNLTSEGIQLKDVRFAVEGGIHWNPLRAGVGPQAFVNLQNTSDHEMHLAVAIALFDKDGNLLGATEASHIGSLDPQEKAEMKLTFREVKRQFFEATTAQIALETWK